jgi:hypothetical protein
MRENQAHKEFHRENYIADVTAWLRSELEPIEYLIPGHADANYSACLYRIALALGAKNFEPPKKGKTR